MKLKYKFPKGHRRNKQFKGIVTTNKNYQFDWRVNRWLKTEHPRIRVYSHLQPCESMRAFRRKLKNAPDGIEFLLIREWKNFEIKGIGSNKK